MKFQICNDYGIHSQNKLNTIKINILLANMVLTPVSKDRPLRADLRYWEKDNISPSTQIVATRKG